MHGNGARVVVSAVPDAVVSLPPLTGSAVVAPLPEALVVVVVVVVAPDGVVAVLVVVAPEVVGVADVGRGVGANVKERLVGQLVRLPVVVRNVPLSALPQRSGMKEPDAAPKQAPEPSAAQ